MNKILEEQHEDSERKINDAEDSGLVIKTQESHRALEDKHQSDFKSLKDSVHVDTLIKKYEDKSNSMSLYSVKRGQLKQQKEPTLDLSDDEHASFSQTSKTETVSEIAFQPIFARLSGDGKLDKKIMEAVQDCCILNKSGDKIPIFIFETPDQNKL